jgi:hypothetical protein
MFAMIWNGKILNQENSPASVDRNLAKNKKEVKVPPVLPETMPPLITPRRLNRWNAGQGRQPPPSSKKRSACIAEKHGEIYSHVYGAMRDRLSITIVQATHLCLHGSRIPASQMSNRQLQWEDGAGLGTFRF